MNAHVPFLLLALALPGLALSDSDDADPPGRVARLSFIRGDVTFQSADSQATEKAVLNRPVTTGNRLITGTDSRSELTLGLAAVRLDERTDLSVANLDEDIAQFEINSGTVGVHLRELEDGQTLEIDAPNSAIRLLEPGDYRVDIEPDGAVLLSVRAGRAEIDSGSGPTRVREGEQARLAHQDQVVDIRGLGREDAFDNWGDDRERQLNGKESSRHVSREVVGYEDLDSYGDWRTEAEYGAVWYPRVAMGWSPYSFGRWAWVSPWGWTWIDYSPWGFAPFHYGRWAYTRSRWCWVPGPRHYRPIYAPALVGWVGAPYSGISVSVSTGRVGWFPLGPREVYVPYRRVSPRYLHRVNVSNTVIVNNTYITNVSRNRVKDIHYANRTVPGALITRPRQEFDSRRPPERREWTTDHNLRDRDDRNWRTDRNDADDRNRANDRRDDNGRDEHGNRSEWNDRTTERRTLAPNRTVEPRIDSPRNFEREDRNRENRDRTDRSRDFNRSFDRDRAINRTTEQSQQWRRENPAERPRQERRESYNGSAQLQRHNHAYRIPDQTNRTAPPAERRAMPSRPPEAAQPQVRRPPPPARAEMQGKGSSEERQNRSDDRENNKREHRNHRR